MTMSHSGESLNINNITTWISDRFTKIPLWFSHQLTLQVPADHHGGKTRFDTDTGKVCAIKFICTTIEFRNRHNVIAHLCNGLDSISNRGHTRCHSNCCNPSPSPKAATRCSNTSVGWVRDTRVRYCQVLLSQMNQHHVLRIIKCIRGGLVNRHHATALVVGSG